MAAAMTFPGGSAWAMVRDLAAGYISPTVSTFKRLKPTELSQFGMEIERKLREVRARQIDLNDIEALKLRNRELLRLTGAQRMLQHSRQRARR